MHFITRSQSRSWFFFQGWSQSQSWSRQKKSYVFLFFPYSTQSIFSPLLSFLFILFPSSSLFFSFFLSKFPSIFQFSQFSPLISSFIPFFPFLNSFLYFNSLFFFFSSFFFSPFQIFLSFMICNFVPRGRG